MDLRQVTISGERSMTQGFIAQYAAEASLKTKGVSSLDSGVIAKIKEIITGEDEVKGVSVRFTQSQTEIESITVYPIVYFGQILPELAWAIQENVKKDVENYTGLNVHTVNVQVMGIEEEGELDE